MSLVHACMNVSAGLNNAHATPFPSFVLYIKAGRIILVPAPATGHRGQRYDRSRTHASLLWEARMLIMIWKQS